MRKLVISLLFLLSPFYAAFWCSYENEILACNKAIKDWNPSSIEDYVCLPSWSEYTRVYQIVLDDKFKGVDEKVNQYLELLQKDKTRFLKQEPWSTPIDWLEEITEFFSKNWPVYRDYMYFCGLEGGSNPDSLRISEEAVTCLWSWRVSRTELILMDNSCEALVDTKLSIYRNTALSILLQNKAQVRVDLRKEYFSNNRERYNTLIDKFIVNIRYLDSIAKWWPSKTKYPK